MVVVADGLFFFFGGLPRGLPVPPKAFPPLVDVEAELATDGSLPSSSFTPPPPSFLITSPPLFSSSSSLPSSSEYVGAIEGVVGSGLEAILPERRRVEALIVCLRKGERERVEGEKTNEAGSASALPSN